MKYDKNNRLLTYNGENVEYDKDGNMVYGPLNGSMAAFTYDCRNRLVKAGDTVYEYDAENNRTAVTVGTKRAEYVVNSQPELSQMLQSTVTDTASKETKQEVTYYFYGKGLQSQENDTDGYLTYHFNNVGSTMAVTDSEGKVVQTYNYTPYGELLDGTYSDNISFLYNGQYGVTTDANGLYYMRARYYNVDIKRFVNQDVLTGTLERISSLNRYAYVEGNPVSFLDPFGLEKTYWEQMHEELQTISLIIMTLQALVACAMVLVPEFIPIGLSIEEGLNAAGNLATILDTYALLRMSGEAETDKEKWKLRVEAAMGIGKNILGKNVSDKFTQILDNSDFSEIMSQIIPALQQCIDNIFAD